MLDKISSRTLIDSLVVGYEMGIAEPIIIDIKTARMTRFLNAISRADIRSDEVLCLCGCLDDEEGQLNGAGFIAKLRTTITPDHGRAIKGHAKQSKPNNRAKAMKSHRGDLVRIVTDQFLRAASNSQGALDSFGQLFIHIRHWPYKPRILEQEIFRRIWDRRSSASNPTPSGNRALPSLEDSGSRRTSKPIPLAGKQAGTQSANADPLTLPSCTPSSQT
ncbi:hypothetical protein PGTUg99_010748 [Puccinia graminis f. sp. tritici]|uniref:Uncharacterized protein n=1 Tax=Puccinia graminis f. sp. tritici TaxID=56615 RepID=A0A5B0RXR0_PUCGR|nr:hypothetical protein PGTUg99_010748 [Puccinia graminis f. sp. tritici]